VSAPITRSYQSQKSQLCDNRLIGFSIPDYQIVKSYWWIPIILNITFTFAQIWPSQNTTNAEVVIANISWLQCRWPGTQPLLPHDCNVGGLEPNHYFHMTAPITKRYPITTKPKVLTDNWSNRQSILSSNHVTRWWMRVLIHVYSPGGLEHGHYFYVTAPMTKPHPMTTKPVKNNWLIRFGTPFALSGDHVNEPGDCVCSVKYTHSFP
jgi:hypothetical protein